jgi:thiol-disulfide isomerase/thioredoxin
MMKQMLIVGLLFISIGGFAQDKKKVEFKRKGTFSGKKSETPDAELGSKLPEFQIMNANKDLVAKSDLVKPGLPCVVMFFNPSCGHCQDATRMFKDSLSQYKNIPFVLITGDNMANEIRTFAEMTGVTNVSNITIGADYSKISELLFEYKGIPQLMFYDKNQILKTKLYKDFHAVDVSRQLDALLK